MHYHNFLQVRKAYTLMSCQNGKWEYVYGISIQSSLGLNDIKWDYVSLQQSSGSSGFISSYGNLLPLKNLISKYMSEKLNYIPKFIFNMTWAYQQDSSHGEFYKYNNSQIEMYEAIVSVMKSDIIKQYSNIIIPNGTAIQNARTSYLDDTLTRDGFHMSLTHGRYVVGLTAFLKLTGQEISDDIFVPTSIINDKEVCFEACVSAINTPFEVTNSNYTTKN